MVFEHFDSIKTSVLRRLSAMVGPIYRGVGCVLAFHRVANSGGAIRLGNQSIEMPPEFVEQVIVLLATEGYEFVPINDVPRLLAESRRDRRFVVVTFDDGYIETLSLALPILERHQVPFTVYVVPGFADGTAPIWWYLLEEKLLRESNVELKYRGSRWWRTRTVDEKQAAFDSISALFAAATTRESARLGELLFGTAAIKEAAQRLALSWDQIREMNSSPLVTIGAHTLTHPPLRLLPRDEALWQMRGSREAIEKQINAPVEHFAFPFGNATRAGPREFELAREAGFVTAATTRVANLFPGHSRSLHSLPRLYTLTPDLGEMRLCLSGSVSAMRYRGRRTVND
ncbi:MAG: hypothetical protein A2341_04395 [Deltaproteobacteria bacterium RIFOXYB12_FULL_58_9]|nr:MAG: hypothetical protein A2341_04395 [Deltaproteobacteria bacterium RIFOXYB12_FULL_58_9]